MTITNVSINYTVEKSCVLASFSHSPSLTIPFVRCCLTLTLKLLNARLRFDLLAIAGATLSDSLCVCPCPCPSTRILGSALNDSIVCPDTRGRESTDTQLVPYDYFDWPTERASREQLFIAGKIPTDDQKEEE